MASASPEASSSSDVFVSYKREERARVAPIIDRLRELGLAVWFDAALNPGAQFDEEILEQLGHSRVHLVCWTVASVESRWVRAEAALSASKSILVPVFLEPCQPKPPFNIDHIEDLSNWDGRRDHFGWLKVLSRIGQLTGRGDALKQWEEISQQRDPNLLREFVSTFPDDPLAAGARKQIFALELAATRKQLLEELGLPGDEATQEKDLKEELSRLRRQLDQSKSNSARATSDFRAALAAYESDLANAKQTNSVLAQDLAARDAEAKAVRDELKVLRSDELNLSRKLSAAEQLVQGAVGQRDSLKAELDALKQRSVSAPKASSVKNLVWAFLGVSMVAIFIGLLLADGYYASAIAILLVEVLFVASRLQKRSSK